MAQLKKILLTGGSGYIGSNLTQVLGDRFSFINFDIRNKKADDVRNLNRLEEAVEGVDGVMHLAAISRPKWGFEDPHTCVTTNVLGTLNVLEALRRYNPQGWIILGSSREVFAGLNKFPVTEEDPKRPLNAYGVSKLTGEDLLKQYAENYDLRSLVIRFCGVYTGKKDILDRVIPRFIGLALRDESLTIEGNGKKKVYDYVYITDVLAALEKAIHFIEKKPKGFFDDINLVADSPISTLNLARFIVTLTESKSKITLLPERTYDTGGGFTGSYRKARKLLSWSPTVDLESGLTRSIEELKPIFLKGSYTR